MTDTPDYHGDDLDEQGLPLEVPERDDEPGDGTDVDEEDEAREWPDPEGGVQ